MRKSNLKRIILASLVPLALLLAGCVSDGGGSDTETLTGLLRTADGQPAANAKVKLIPTAYDPSKPEPGLIRTVYTDAKGAYRFDRSPAAGSFNLLAVGASSDAAAFEAGLPADSVPATLTLSKARVVFLSLHNETYATADSGKAWFPGTDVFIRCEGVTATKLETVPRGMDNMVIESRAGWRHDYRITNPADSLAIHADRNQVRCDAY